MKKLLLGMMFVFSLSGTATSCSKVENTLVSASIVQFVEQTKAECAQIIYDLVKDAVANVATLNDGSLYQKAKQVFEGKQMLQILHLGQGYGSVAQLYLEAARLARQANDIDVVIVLHVAAHQASCRPWYDHYKLFFAAALGLSVPLVYYLNMTYNN